MGVAVGMEWCITRDTLMECRPCRLYFQLYATNKGTRGNGREQQGRDSQSHKCGVGHLQPKYKGHERKEASRHGFMHSGRNMRYVVMHTAMVTGLMTTCIVCLRVLACNARRCLA